MEIFKRKKYIYTEYEAEHIVNLEAANVPYEIREEIAFFEKTARKGRGWATVSKCE